MIYHFRGQLVSNLKVVATIGGSYDVTLQWCGTHGHGARKMKLGAIGASHVSGVHAFLKLRSVAKAERDPSDGLYLETAGNRCADFRSQSQVARSFE